MVHSLGDTLFTSLRTANWKRKCFRILSMILHSSLMYTDIAKYCKRLMYYIHSYYQEVKVTLKISSKTASLWYWTTRFCQLEDLSKKKCSWTSLKGILANTVNNKYRSKTPWSKSLGSHVTTKQVNQNQHNKLILIGDVKPRILRDSLEAADLHSREIPQGLQNTDDLREWTAFAQDVGSQPLIPILFFICLLTVILLIFCKLLAVTHPWWSFFSFVPFLLKLLHHSIMILTPVSDDPANIRFHHVMSNSLYPGYLCVPTRYYFLCNQDGESCLPHTNISCTLGIVSQKLSVHR